MERFGPYMTRFSIVAIAALVLLSAMAMPVQAQEEESVESESNVIVDVVLPVSLAFIMFSLGIGLTIEDFALIFREPKAFGVGIVNQMVVLPLMGFAVATGAGLEGELAVGLIILACCPGGHFQHNHEAREGGYSPLDILHGCGFSRYGHNSPDNSRIIHGSLHGWGQCGL